MKLISEQYRSLNAKAHKTQKGYGAKGGRRRAEVLHIANKYDAKTALDYGCGKGDLKRRVPELQWEQYDPAVAEYSDIPEGIFDLVMCGDVLEHIEMDTLDNVLAHLLSLIGRVGLFVINTKQGRRRLPDGTYAHRIVQPAGWWVTQIQSRASYEFNIEEWFHKENGDVFIIIKKEHE
jgi:2-polyprenyl-3-methyl-5-hydroxy-6-metoxy-1,4-benzoquinol methylase